MDNVSENNVIANGSVKDDACNIIKRCYEDALSGSLSYLKMVPVTKVLYMAGHYSTVINIYRAWLASNASIFRHLVYCDLGDALVKQGDFIGAEEAYRSALRCNGSFLRAKTALAKLNIVEARIFRGEEITLKRFISPILTEDDISQQEVYWNNYGVLFDKNGKYIESGIMEVDFVTIFGCKIKDFSISNIDVNESLCGDVVIPSINMDCGNYYHFMIYHISRIIMSIHACDKYPNIIFSNALAGRLVDSYKNDIFSQIMNVFGVDECVKISSIPNKSVARLGRCYLPNTEDYTDNFLPSAVPLFSAAARRITGKTSPLRRIYISRKLPAGRCVSNEEELLTVLRKYDFTTLNLEDMSIEDQIVAFRDADFIVGPHGAGFTNLLFSRNGTKVIEFLHEESPEVQFRFFSKISSIVGCDHAIIVSKAVNHPWYAPGVQSNIEVDCGALTSIIEDMLFA